eukprot:TRINITY_DN8874_c0_g2_i1.p1 TRINITY_DN8874_c0_g2~~TRINITY_DN8874_c0_g2_i1.p1  ORF type:complete len:118 (+),score=11.15 TRINITY_DN8874_c0_g2_i1:28-381(+)
MAPSYELSLILRSMDKAQLVQAVKPICSQILNNGGIIRDVSSQGNLDLPYRMKAHFEYHKVGRYATVEFDSSPTTMQAIVQSCTSDQNIIRHNILKKRDITKLGDINACRHAKTSKA